MRGEMMTGRVEGIYLCKKKIEKKAANRKRKNTSPPYQTRSQYKKKKQRIQKKPYNIPTGESEHDIETDMSGIVTETDSDRLESESPAMSAIESLHIVIPPILQLNDEGQRSGSTGALRRKPSRTLRFIQKNIPSRARVALNDITDI